MSINKILNQENNNMPTFEKQLKRNDCKTNVSVYKLRQHYYTESCREAT